MPRFSCGLSLDMRKTKRNKLIRIFFYLLLFVPSFLIFDAQTVVIIVFFAIFALEYFLARSEKRNGL